MYTNSSSLFQGEAKDCLRRLTDESVSLVVSSPPYNLGKEYEEKVPLGRYLEDQEEVLCELYRVLRPEGSICWQVGNFVENGEVYPLDILYYPIFKKLGFRLRNRVIWRFGHGLHARRRFSGRYETILWFSKSDRYVFNLDAVRIPQKYPDKRHFKGPNRGKPSCHPLGKNPSDVWEVLAQDWEELVWDIPNVKANHPEKTVHPCQFPIELAQRCVLALSNDGDLVLDPYMGFGTTVIAAMMCGRRAIGCEREPQYVELARSRIEDFLCGKLRYRPIGRPVF